MSTSDLQEKDRPSPDSADDENLFLHIVDAMPLGVSCSIVFISFFFFWGAAINLLKFLSALTRHVMPALSVGAGSLIGALSALAVALILWKTKTRRRK